MKLGIMQPYFFPYLGYFQLIQAVDKWVVFDIAQYMRHQWVNRNRVLHPTSGSQYIIVPLKKHRREAPIKDILVAEGQDWENRILAQLDHYRKSAPFFRETIAFLRDCFFSRDAEERSLSRLNTLFVERVCERLDIGFDHSVCSEMSLRLEDVAGPGDWALRIAEQVGAEEYLNPAGGQDLFEPAKFRERGITLTVLASKPIRYEQNGYQSETGLSVIDVMMWNSPATIRTLLKEYELNRLS